MHSNKGYHYRQLQQSMTRAYDVNKIEKVSTVMHYFEGMMESSYSTYGHQIDMFYSFLIKDIVANEMKSDVGFREINRKLSVFRMDKLVERTLNNVTGVPRLYAAMFKLYKNKLYIPLTLLFRLFNKYKKKEDIV